MTRRAASRYAIPYLRPHKYGHVPPILPNATGDIYRCAADQADALRRRLCG